MRARVRQGDREAFGELFEDCARAVHHHAHRLTGDWTQAEDVMALTFLEAWRLRRRIDPEGGSLRPWLLGIATNVVRNQRRAGRRHQAALERMPKNEVTPDFSDDLVQRLDTADTLAEARRVFLSLNRREQDVIALCVWAGLEYGEAAEALGVPVGTIKSRLSRARGKLRRAMEPQAARRQVESDRDPTVRTSGEERP